MKCPRFAAYLSLLVAIYGFVSTHTIHGAGLRDVAVGIGRLSEAEIQSLSDKEVFDSAISANLRKDSTALFKEVSSVDEPPTVCKFVIANPRQFILNPTISKNYGFDWQSTGKGLTELLSDLPVIYLADQHSDYGNLGYMLNRKSPKTVRDFYPGLKKLRDRPVYQGGVGERGSSFTMLHSKVGFPENRVFKGIPGNSKFKLFFSPDIAMANELCLTDDADPSDFKFFEWATVWSPRQLEYEYNKGLWITVEGSLEILFANDEADQSMWNRVANSLQSIDFPSAKRTSSTTK